MAFSLFGGRSIVGQSRRIGGGVATLGLVMTFGGSDGFDFSQIDMPTLEGGYFSHQLGPNGLTIFAAANDAPAATAKSRYFSSLGSRGSETTRGTPLTM